jgi:glycosyltransferase involved in cell wall biosynthesis
VLVLRLLAPLPDLRGRKHAALHSEYARTLSERTPDATPHCATIRSAVRICIIYDCLYPWTIGGAERWYRDLAEAFVGDGHEVTYLTRKQWDDEAPPEIAGVRVVAVSGAGQLYHRDGRRLVGPPVRFGAGVLRHLAAHRSSYDVVHTCAFPFFSVPAVRVALLGRPVEIGVDWFEVWSRSYWGDYLGTAGGALGYGVQRLVARVTPRAFVFNDLHARRLREQGYRGTPIRLAGLLARREVEQPVRQGDTSPVAVFAGRLIPEKRARVLPAAIAEARCTLPNLRCTIFGDGPERAEVLAEIERLALGDAIAAPGFVGSAEVDMAIATAMCLVLPSSREGYGLVVVEAASRGTPSIVVAGPDNAATELVEEGVNGFTAGSAGARDIAAAIVRAHAAGPALRATTAAWFDRRRTELSLETSLRRVLAAYAQPAQAVTDSG